MPPEATDLISDRLAAGEGHVGLHSFRRANITMRQEVARDFTVLTQFLAGVIACAKASKAGIPHRDSCAASQSSSGRSAAKLPAVEHRSASKPKCIEWCGPVLYGQRGGI
ncbi:MAG: hypothetical protein ABSG26_25965 [Bryobacteraceae bacterium]|jgi:hypothetical protein